jgi:hypothetical protein
MKYVFDPYPLQVTEYDGEWLASGFSISPLHLPLKSGLFTASYLPFNGDFGIFEDSLPGGYGEYLLQKLPVLCSTNPSARPRWITTRYYS